MKKYIIPFATILFSFCSSTAFAESIFRPYRVGHTDLDFSVEYFKASGNFLPDGSTSTLPSGFQFQTVNILTGARYVLIEDLAVTLQLGIGNAESNDAIATRKNSSISHASLGADYQVFTSDLFNVIGDLSYSYAAEKVSPTTDSAINNTGADEIKAVLSTTFDLGTFAPFVSGGINYRTEGLSTLFLYTVGTSIHFESLVIGGAINGYISIKDDEKTNQPLSRDTITNRVNGASKRYYSINPSLIDTELYLKYEFNRDLAMKFFGGYPIAGTNSAQGIHAGVGVTWGYGGSKASTIRQKPPAKKSVIIDPADKNFKEDTNDGVNQDYFKPVNPSKDKYIEQLEGSSQNLKNATEPEPAEETIKMRPAVNPALEKDYKIKLKKKKKRK